MAQLPATFENRQVGIVPVPTPDPGDAEDEIPVRRIWAALVRSRWVILACVVGVMSVAGYVTSRTVPVYEASATLRIDPREPNLPDVFRTMKREGELATEAEELQSRTLAEDVAAVLALQVRLLAPRRVGRGDVLDSIVVAPDAVPGRYELRPNGEDSVQVRDVDRGTDTVVAVNDGWVELKGTSVRLSPAAADHDLLLVAVGSLAGAAGTVRGNLSVISPKRDGKILEVRYEDTDRDIVWRVPNALLERYLARRRAIESSEAKRVIGFLRQQLDTVSVQLAAAEDALRRYREEQRVVAPQAEATTQVTRLLSLEADRSGLDAERAALANLLEAADRRAAAQKPDEGSPYRELMAFPTLLKNGAARDLMETLTRVEEDRRTLLTRRTERDPDVVALTERIAELHGQIRAQVVTYLAGLSNQVTTIDGTLARYKQQLTTVPLKELQVVRHERKARVFEEVHKLLQTRLKEAEISSAAQDVSGRVLDPAVAPRWPIRPRFKLNLAAGLMGGLLLGMALAGLREFWDRSVRTRNDVRAATGLPVLGLIPRIPGRSSRFALIAENGRPPREAVAGSGAPRVAPVVPARLPAATRSYTFLASEQSAPAASPLSLESGSVQARHEMPRWVVAQRGMVVAEALSSLQTNLMFAHTQGDLKTLLVTSPLPGEGKTTTTVNFALSLVRRGLRVVLVDADLRRGSMHTAFNVPRHPGFSDLLQGAAPFRTACRMIELEGRELHYLTAGTAVANPLSLLESAEARTVLAELRGAYDTVLIDSPPVNVVTDASVLAASVDAVVIVVRAAVTDSSALSYALEQLRRVHAPVLGVVLNDIDPRRDSVYDGAYKYYNYGEYITPKA